MPAPSESGAGVGWLRSTAGLPARAWLRRDVFLELTWRDITQRYSGSFLGMLWSFFNPLLMLAVYTLAFRVFLRMRWPGMASGTGFALMIFCGMVVHSTLAECLTRAPGTIVSQTNLVKRVVFPLAVLPCVTVATALFNMLLSVVVLLVFVLAVQHSLHPAVVLLPVIYIPFVILLCGVSWFMASLGVFVRDVVQIAGVLTAMLMFLSPVFYPASSVREPFRGWMAYNPLTLMIEQTRRIVVDGQMPDWSALGVYALAAIVVMVLGYAWFQRTRDGFADVL